MHSILLVLCLAFSLTHRAHSAAALDKGQKAIEQTDPLGSISKEECPTLLPKMFVGKVPKGKLDKKDFKYSKFDALSVEDCVRGCCGDDSCNMAFIYSNETKIICYKISCNQDESCLPTDPDQRHPAASSESQTSVVLVRTQGQKSWADLLKAVPKKNQDSVEQQQKQNRWCEVGLELEQCYENEVCKTENSKSRNGVCTCKEGFARNAEGECEDKVTAQTTPKSPKSTTSTAPTSPKKIVVQVVSKEVQLPENSVDLVAYPYPDAPEGTSYSYSWNLVSVSKPGSTSLANEKQKLSGNMNGGNSQTLSLTDLEEGIYVFKVMVTLSDPPSIGETTANVTVLPPKRINEPPHAIVKPKFQLINLPTSRAIIDASESTDDAPKDKLIFKWELVAVPLGFQQTLPEGPTLTLDDLIAGNYTVKVTVTDEDGASDEAEAKIEVQPETDYPPTANAGEDIIINLPNNKVVLHGNQSSDDHGIVSWEWTRKLNPDDGRELAFDSTSMRTPFPTISNLEKGTYTFILKVTDAKGQSSEDEVNIYVKDPVSLAPVANAGKDQEISLPQTWVTLDGSKSTDDVAIAAYSWKVLTGPNVDKVSFSNGSSAVTNATNLTKGSYTFELTVEDNQGNRNKSTVNVKVNQDTNAEPIANAGDKVNVTMPVTEVILNGTKSSDDLGIVKWLWTRQLGSLAAGKIVRGTESSPIMRLVDLVPGEYSFQLQVWDEQGKTSTSSVSVTVNDNPNQLNVVQMVLKTSLKALKQSVLQNLIQNLELLLHSNGKYNIEIVDMFSQMDTDYAVVQFIVLLTEDEDGNELTKDNVASGVKIVNKLNSRLETDSELLTVKILSLDTLVCQNDCSGHGTCDPNTRECICDPFWMQNFVRRQFMDGVSNCEWSIIYFCIFMGLFACGMVSCACYTSCKKSKIANKFSRSRRGKRKAKYTKLQQSEPNIELRNPHTSSLMISESDSDDELFVGHENGTVVRDLKSNGNGDVQRRNGFSRGNIADSQA